MVNERDIEAWGASQPGVRGMLLTSSRAVSGAHLDRLSDWDLILVVEEVESWMIERDWITDFGEVLVAYWDPVAPDDVTGLPVGGNVVQYAGTLKIDFSLWPTAMIDVIAAQASLPPELDAGYRIVLDKDGLLRSLPSPTGQGYRIEPPTPEVYQTLINDFFIGVPYVAKMLLRRDVLPAKWCLDFDMRYVYLVPMLEWRVGVDQAWTKAPGIHGRRLPAGLSSATWDQLEHTYAGLDVDHNWRALFAMIEVFRAVATEVGEALGFHYPADLDRRVTEHARHMRDEGL